MKFNDPKEYYLVNIIIVVVFVLLSLSAYSLVRTKNQASIENNLNLALSDLSLTVLDQVHRSTEKLSSIAPILAFSDNLKLIDFERYVRVQTDDSKAWFIIEWQPIVRGSERQLFEEQARQLINSDYSLWEPDLNGEQVAAAVRDIHVPVLFMLSTSDAVNTTGLDLAWSEERMESKWLARDTGRVRLSNLFHIVLGPNDKNAPAGFALTLPVFNGGLIPDSIAERRSNIKGYLAGVYAISDVLSAEISLLSSNGFYIEIRDVELTLPVFSTLDTTHIDDPISAIERVSLLGRSWEITLVSSRSAMGQKIENFWWLLPYTVLLLGLLMMTILRFFYKKNVELEAVKVQLQRSLEKVTESERHFASLSKHDPLTNLLNRRAFFDELENELIRATRYKEEFSLLLIDIDYFKIVNDTYGHPVGDIVIQNFSARCEKMSRESDVLCRFGGEEFVILLINTSKSDSIAFANRLCEATRNSVIQIDYEEQLALNVTVSIGITSYENDDTSNSLIAKADKALYQAKHTGRDRVCIN